MAALEKKSILDETFFRLTRLFPVDHYYIKDIFLGNYFNVIELNDKTSGAAMNYYHFVSPRQNLTTHRSLISRLKKDPLLLDFFSCQEKEQALLRLSLKCALVIALSKKIPFSDRDFRVAHALPDVFPGHEKAVVIGFGGYMDYLIRHPFVEAVHISDLNYHARKVEMDRVVAKYRREFPEKKITISDACGIKSKIQRAGVICITGSSLCNGTVDGLLDMAKGKNIAVQGVSAGIYPVVMFERGVSFVDTWIAADGLAVLARKRPRVFRSLLENNRSTFFLPKV